MNGYPNSRLGFVRLRSEDVRDRLDAAVVPDRGSDL